MPHTLIYAQYDSPEALDHLTTDVRRSSDISVTARPQGGNPISREPRNGVVGPDMRVHGHRNLRVCDASVFPTSVVRNPRLVAMALAELASTTLD